jgi:hypothetical protein
MLGYVTSTGPLVLSKILQREEQRREGTSLQDGVVGDIREWAGRVKSAGARDTCQNWVSTGGEEGKEGGPRKQG